MARKGFRKLIDVRDRALLSTPEWRLRLALEKFLRSHAIPWRLSRHDGFVRYLVAPEDLCCALAGLDAVYEMAGVVR